MTGARPDTWMPFYVGDYLGDTMHFSTLEHGAYCLLIFAYWRNGGPLDDDDSQMAAIARMTARQWDSARRVIAPKFKIVDGRWVHKRIEEELERSARIYAERAGAGSKGGRKSQANRKQNSSRASPELEAKSNYPQSHSSIEEVVDDSARESDAWKAAYQWTEATLNQGTPLNGSRIHAWLAAGADLELDIKPTITRLLANMNGRGPPSSLKYFDRAIADAMVTRTTPMPHGKRLPTKDDRYAAINKAVAEFSAFCRDESSDGPSDSRALPVLSAPKHSH